MEAEPSRADHDRPDMMHLLPASSTASSSSSDSRAAMAHTDTASEPTSPPSPRTPSPILGSRHAAHTYSEADGHLTFPQVGVGLGTMEQEMNMLMDLENLDHDDDACDVGRANVADVMAELERLGYTPPATDHDALPLASDDAKTRDTRLADLVWQLGRRVQKHEQAREHLLHRLRVTRLASLSLFSSLRISYSHMLQAERDIKARLEVELSGSKIQSKMLSDMVSRASIAQEADDDVVRRTPDTERSKLLADKRYLRQRVKDAEAQVARLEKELRDLRPMLLRATIEDEAPDSTPRSKLPQRPRRREAVMGDATAEHLILATRMLRTLRQAAPHGPDASPSKSLTSTPRRPRETYPPTTPQPRLDVLTSPEAPASTRSMPSSTYSSGIDDLLHAAQSLSSHYHQPDMSPTRPMPWHRRVSHDELPLSAPVLGSPKRRRVLSMDVDETPSVSALDVLANQAVGEQHPPSPTTPRRYYDQASYPYMPSGSTSLPSSTRTTPTKPKSLGGQSPEKRLPYVRWSTDEDIKLRRAIKEHGQRWEYVARAVGTRSYHQCRQRYLLMRRKEAAANGLTSPSKSQASSARPSGLAPPPATRDDKSPSSSSDTEALPPPTASSSSTALETAHLFHAQHHHHPPPHVALPPPLSMPQQALHS